MKVVTIIEIQNCHDPRLTGVIVSCSCPSLVKDVEKIFEDFNKSQQGRDIGYKKDVWEWPLTEEGLKEAENIVDNLCDRGWCQIVDLSGELDKDLYMATFTDNSRILFEVGEGTLRLLLSREQESRFNDNLTEEEKKQTIASVVFWYDNP